MIYKPATSGDALTANTFTGLGIQGANQATYDNSNGIQLKAYVIQHRVLVQIYYFTKLPQAITTNSIPITVAVNTPDIDSTLIPKSTRIKYSISITLPSGTGANAVPAGGVIDIQFPTGFTLESFCQNDASSQMTSATPGAIACVPTPDNTKYSGSPYYAISGYQTITIGYKIKIIAYATTPTTSATAGNLYIYADTARTQQMYTSVVTFPAVQTTYTGFQMLKVADEGRTPFIVRVNDKSFFQFQLIPGSLPTSITLSFPIASAVTLESGASPICYFGDSEAASCKTTTLAGASLALTITPPISPVISATTTYLVTVDTTCGTKNGLIFGAAGKYLASVTIGSNTISFPFRVLSSIDFTLASMIMTWANQGTKAHLIVQFTPTTSIPTNGKVVLTFPSKNSLGTMTLFKQNLGYTTASYDGAPIDCYSVTTSTLIPLGGEIVCKLYIYGANPFVEVSGFQAVSSAATFIIQNIELPIVSTDNGYVDIRLHSEDTNGNILDERVIFDVFTPSSQVTSEPNRMFLETINCDPSCTLTISGISLINTRELTPTANARIVSVFPSNYNLDPSATTVSGTPATPGFSSKIYKNVIISTPQLTATGAGIAASSSVSLSYSGFSVIPGIYTSNTIEVYVLYDRVYTSRYYVALTVATNPDFVVDTDFSLTVGNSFAGVVSDYRFSFSPAVGLSANSVIAIEFSSGFVIGPIQVISGLIGPNTISVTSSTIYVTLSNSYALSNGQISIQVSVTNPTTAGSFSTQLHIYSDLSQEITIQKVPPITLTIDSPPTSTFSTNCFVSLAGTDLTLTLTPNAQTVNTLTGSGGYGIRIYGVPMAGVSGAVFSANENYIMISSSTEFVASTTYTITASNINVDTKSLLYSFMILVAVEGTPTTFYEMCPTAVFATSKKAAASDQFTSSTITYGHLTIGELNYFEATVTTSIAFSYTLTTGMYMAFSSGFATDLGFALNDGDNVPCYISGHTNLKCVLSRADSNSKGETRIYLQNFNSLIIGDTISVFFFRIPNPPIAGYYSVRFTFFDDTNSNGNFDQIIAYIESLLLMAPLSGSVTTSSSALSGLSTFNLQESTSGTQTLQTTLSLSPNDQILFILDQVNFNTVAVDSATVDSGTTDVTCTWYKAGQMAICIVINAITGGISFQITNFNNPTHNKDNIAFITYSVVVTDVMESITWTANFNTGSAMGTAIAMDAGGGTVRWMMGLTLPSNIPKGGCIELSMGSGTFSTPSLVSLEIFSGSYTGKIKAQLIGSKLYLRNFDWYTGSTTVLNFILTMSGATSGGTCTVTVTSYAIVPENFGSKIYSIDSGSFTLSAPATLSTVSAWSPTKVILGYTRPAKSSNSFISFKLKLTSDLTATQYIRLRPSAAFSLTLTITKPLRCRFNLVGRGSYYLNPGYASKSCYITAVSTTSNIFDIVIQAPASTSNPITAANYWEIMIFLGETDKAVPGFQTSGNNFQYPMGVYLLSNNVSPSSSNIVEYNTVVFSNFLSYSEGGCVRSIRSEASISNLLHFDVTLANPTTAGSDYLEILLPLTRFVSSSTETLYSQNLGSASNILSDFKCNFISGFAITSICQIWYGQSGYENRPSRITISNYGSLSSGAIISFDIPNLINPATGIFTSAVFQTYTLNSTFGKQIKDYYNFPYVTYTVTPTAPTTVAGSFPNPTSGGLAVDSVITMTLSPSGVCSLTEFDGYLFTYDTNFFNPTIAATPSGTMGSVTVTNYFLKQGNTFIILNPGQTSTCTQSVLWSNLKNTPLSGAYTSASGWSMSLITNHVITKIFTFVANANPTYTGSTFTIVTSPSNLAVRVATSLATSLSASSAYSIQFDFTVGFSLEINSAIRITFPTGFTNIKTSATFTAGYSGTYSVAVSSQAVIIYNNNQAIASGTVMTLILKATSAAVGPVGAFKYDAFISYPPTATNQKATLTSPTGLLTISSQVGINGLKIKSLSVWKAVQENDYGPAEFIFTAASAITKKSGWLKVTSGTLLWTSLVVSGATYDDLKCFWGDLAAFNCQIINQGFQIFAPTSVDISSGSKYVIFVATNRLMTDGGQAQEDFKYTATATYTMTMTPSAGTPTSATFILPPPDFPNSYINNYITTISCFSIFKVSLTPTVNINGNTGSTPGQILIEFPTANAAGTSLFPNDLGTGYKNGDLLDCDCTGSCPAGLQCKLNKGGNSILSPSYIIVDSTAGFSASSNFRLKFPKIQMPSTDKLFLQMRIVSRSYATGVWSVLNELVHIDIFYSTTYTWATVSTGLTTPAYSPNLVGQPGTISFGLTNDVGTLTAGLDDRYILESTTSEMVFELPPSSYRGTSYTLSVAGCTVTLYAKCKWIEVKPTPSNLPSQTTLTLNALKNMPYLIGNNGINFNVKIWIGGDLRQIYTFPKTAQAQVNTFIQETYSPNPPVIILQPNTYTFTFQPYNRIPQNGKIVLFLPNCGTACDFVFFDSYCLVQGGISDASCDIVPGSPASMVVKGLSQIYDPFLPTSAPISIVFYMQNPSTTSAPGTSYFILRTYFVDNNDAYMMDQELQFDAQSNRYSLQGGYIIVALVQDVMQVPVVLCAGRTGPLILLLQFSGDLSYPNDYITINFYTSFSYTPATPIDELLCYFDDLSNTAISYVKSFRCEYSTPAAGNTLTIYIPEELSPLSHLKQYRLSILSKISGGLTAASPSSIYWATITTSATNDRAWTEVRIPACPFDSSFLSLYDTTVTPSIYYLDTTFFITSWSGEISNDYVTDPTWTGINMTLKTTASAIPTGNLAVAKHSRILIEFPTNNELDPCWDVNLGVITTGDSAEAGCAGQYHTGRTPLYPDPYVGNSTCSACRILCTAVQGAAAADNSTPAYVMFNYYEAIGPKTKFNLQVTRIANPKIINAFSHIIIHVQSRMDDGSYYDIYYHPKFHLIPSYTALPGGVGMVNYPKTVTGAGRSGLYSNSVTKDMGNVSWTINPIPFNMFIGDVVVFEQSIPYYMSRRTNCVQMRSNGYWWNPVLRPQMGCASSYASRWYTIHNSLDLTAGTDQFYVVDYINWYENNNWVNPDYEYKNPNGSPKSLVNVYIYRSQKLMKFYQFYQTPTRENIRLVLQTSDAQNDVNAVITYRLGIILGTPKPTLKYIRIWAPLSFQSVSNCIIRRGLVLVDMAHPENPIVCQVTPGASNYLIEIYNFGTYNGDGWLMLSLDLKNPATVGWTNYWTAETYGSQPVGATPADLTMILDSSVSAGNNDAITWVGVKPFPNLFRVYRNKVSYYNRKASLGQYAEVDIRLIPKTTLPSTAGGTSAWVEVWMPNNFDIPNGGTAVCEMGQNYHTDTTGQYCQISSDRKITMYTNNGQGLGSPCNLMTWTTTGAIGGDGIKLPSTPTTDSFQVYEYINNNLVEYSVPGITTQPQLLTTLTYQSTIREQEGNYNSKYRRTVYRIAFQSNINIPAGYDTTPNIADPLLKNPIGYITYEFNTRDYYVYGYNGYWADLGYASTTTIPCRAIQGLIPPAGGSIICTLTPASPPSNFFSFVLITVSGFQAISTGDFVEIHFLECLPLNSQYNIGYIQVGAYQVNADGTQNQIIKKTTKNLGFYQQDPSIPDLTTPNYLLPNTLWSINPSTNYVGTYSIMTFNFMVTQNMGPGCFIVFRFTSPSQFELKFQSDTEIQAVIDGIVVTTVIYATGPINEIYFQVPTGKTITADSINYKTFQISQIRNMAYEISPTTYQIELLLIQSNGYRQGNWIYDQLPGASAGPYSAKLMVLSSYFSGDVNVLYTFSVTPTYRVPSGSTVTVYFPNHLSSPYIGLNYNHLPLSNPAAVCSVGPSAYFPSSNPCTIFANKTVITTSTDVPENTAIQILVSGAKNPTYVGPTVINDFYIDIKNAAGKTINTEGFPSFVFLASKIANVLYMSIQASSLYQSVNCDYVFSLQPSTTVPSGGQIYLQFPPEWASSALASGCTINSLTGSFTGSVLTYSMSYSAPILTINPGFELPAKSTLYIAMNKLPNPSNVDTTTVFKAYTQYDSVKLDVTDPTDVGLKLTFLHYDPTVYLAQNPTIYPTNEAQTATYNFNLTSTHNISAGSSLELQFSYDFDSSLTTYDKTITCYSVALGGDIPCTVSNGKIIIPINANITNITNTSSSNCSNGSNCSNSSTPSYNPNVYLDLQIRGITNPNSKPGQTNIGTVDIRLRQGSTLISYKNTPCCLFPITPAPQWLNLTFLNTTSTNLQQKSNYTFCVQTHNPIPLNASVMIEFPSQFSLRQKSYGCEVATGHNATTYPLVNAVQTPTCSVNNQLRIVNISNQTSGYNGTSDQGVGVLCYQIDMVENPSDSGESGNFKVSIYDEDKSTILYSTYGVLSYPSTITYSRQGLRITVGDISTLYVGTMSQNISVTLERSVSYAIYLTPTADGFEFLPSVISFFSYLSKTQYFMIRPLSNATLGQNKISWSKNETNSPDQFSEVADTFFNLAQNPSANELKLTISPIILRTAQEGTSLPIKITLSAPAAENMTVHYDTYKPNQPEYVIFNPPNLTFGIGETSKTFTYYTKVLAVSGQILFWLDSAYASKYTMNTNIINFEIMDLDNAPPDILNYYIVDMDRTYMYFRISTSESGWIYWILSYKGTKKPSNHEIRDPSIRVALETQTFWEINGSNSSYQAPVTKTYIYYDTYLYFSGLEEQTDYVLFFLTEDLSGNQNPNNIAFYFTTSSI